MKTIFCGHYRDRTGYGRGAIESLLALDSVGVDVVARPIVYQGNSQPPKRILELEQKSSKGASHALQHTLPHVMSYNGHLQNVAMFASETTGFAGCTWPQRLNVMDKVIVFNKQQVEACNTSGVNRPIYVVNEPSDISRYQREYKPLDIPGGIDLFRFYAIGEFTRRKNFAAALKAFHLEFGSQEPVQFVIKTSSVDQTTIQQFIDSIKAGLKLYPDGRRYHAEVVILEEMSEEDICRLHTSCHCFLATSFGEAWNRPAFDAMAFGRTPIFTNWGGHREYLDESTGYPCDYSIEPVFGQLGGFGDLYTGKEQWANISVEHLRAQMRRAYENDSERYEKAKNGINRAWSFSHHAIGKQLKEVLEK